MQTQHGMSQFYQQMGQAGNVMNASPHRLVSMLLKQAQHKIALAQQANQNHDIATRAQSIHRACAIIDSLRIALDRDAGGEIAAHLEDLYDYLYRRLMQATAMNDETALTEASGILQTLQSGWDGMEHDTGLAATIE